MNPDANASLANTIAVTSGRRLEKLSRERGAGGRFVAAARENPPRIERNAMLLQPFAQALESMLRVNRVPRPAGERDPCVTQLHEVIRHDRRPHHGCRNERAAPGGRLRRARRVPWEAARRPRERISSAISPLRFRDDQPVDTPLSESIRRRCRDRIYRSTPCWPASGCCLVWTTPSRCQPAAA